jgi:isoquinoline 1-oxidoreductase alpha subunit
MHIRSSSQGKHSARTLQAVAVAARLCMIAFTLNQSPVALDVPADKPLLWVLREDARLTGTKFGCGIAACGACTVLLGGMAVRSCVLPVQAVAGQSVTTIEGLAGPDGLHPVQAQWLLDQVPQCGYCQSGMILAVSSLLEQNPQPSDADIDAALTNICRCGTLERVRSAIHKLSSQRANPGPNGLAGPGAVVGADMSVRSAFRSAAVEGQERSHMCEPTRSTAAGSMSAARVSASTPDEQAS